MFFEKKLRALLQRPNPQISSGPSDTIFFENTEVLSRSQWCDHLTFFGFCKGDFYSGQGAGDERIANGANWRSRLEGLGEKTTQSLEKMKWSNH